MKTNPRFCLILLLFAVTTLHAQNAYLSIDESIRLPKDSLEKTNLINSLNDFLFSIGENGNTAGWVVTEEKDETQILIEEIKGITDNEDSNKSYPHLVNCEFLFGSNDYLVQVAYISTENSKPFLNAVFEFVAHKNGNKFLFSSPLLRNTQSWNKKTHKYLTFYYQNKSTENAIDQYSDYISEFDDILNVTRKTHYYFSDDCETLSQLMRLAGILYKSDYNGLTWNSSFFNTDGKEIHFYTQRLSRREVVDSHYIFHARANITAPDKNNLYMVCGAAHIYAGCWGMSWEEMKRMFKEKMTGGKKQDWLQLYYDRYDFGDSKAEYVLVTSFLSGLIIEKVTNEKGFPTAMKLFASGNIYKDKEHFFQILEEVAGINEKNFNKKMDKLIQDSLKGI